MQKQISSVIKCCGMLLLFFYFDACSNAVAYKYSFMMENCQYQECSDYVKKHKQVDVNCTDKYGVSLLYHAALTGDQELVKLLLDRGADPNISGNHGLNPLIIALTKDNFTIAKILIEHGANVNHLTDDHLSPLYLAVKKGNIDLVSDLLEKGAQIHNAYYKGETVIDVAIIRENLEMLQLLLDNCNDFGKDSYAVKGAFDLSKKTENKEIKFVVWTKIIDILRNQIQQKISEEGCDTVYVTTLFDEKVKGKYHDITLSEIIIKDTSNVYRCPIYIIKNVRCADNQTLLYDFIKFAEFLEVDQKEIQKFKTELRHKKQLYEQMKEIGKESEQENREFNIENVNTIIRQKIDEGRISFSDNDGSSIDNAVMITGVINELELKIAITEYLKQKGCNIDELLLKENSWYLNGNMYVEVEYIDKDTLNKRSCIFKYCEL